MSNRLVSHGLMPVALAAAASAIAGAAQSADLGPYDRGYRAPPTAYYPQAYRWSGFYAGIQGGYGWGGTDAVSTTLSNGVTESFSYGTGGGIGGVHAGFNWQTGSLVLGLETDLEASRIGGSGLGTFGGGHISNVDWAGSLRGRLGYAAGNTLLYVTGGLAYGGISVDRSAGAAFTPFVGASEWKTGWTLGAGVEHAFTQNISLRLEYRYTDFGQMTFTNPGNNLTDTSDISYSAVRAGLSIKF